MILTREELVSAVRNIFGEDSTDEQISFIENLSDTVSDFEERITTSGDWKTKYEENDANWRKRYTERFVNPNTTREKIIEGQEEDIIDDGSPKSFAELFKEREG
jgi:hypothetical protein